MNTYKLKFTNALEAETIFLEKGAKQIINNEGVEESVYANGTQGIVTLPPQVKVAGTYDENGEVLTEPIFYSEAFYDIMTSDEIYFVGNEVFPLHASHSFAKM
jgi:hypothetical protein